MKIIYEFIRIINNVVNIIVHRINQKSLIMLLGKVVIAAYVKINRGCFRSAKSTANVPFSYRDGTDIL